MLSDPFCSNKGFSGVFAECKQRRICTRQTRFGPAISGTAGEARVCGLVRLITAASTRRKGHVVGTGNWRLFSYFLKAP